MQKILSICVPTYNRQDKLKELVESVITQITGLEDKVEICISDNDSDDGTKEYLEKLLKSNYKYLHINENKENKGFDKNLILLFGMSSGKFLWMMGDDDLVVNNTLKKLVEFLDGIKDDNINLIYLQVLDGSLPSDSNKFDREITSKEIISNPNGFMSINIVKKSAFEKIGEKILNTGIGTLSIHTWIMRNIAVILPDSKAIHFKIPIVNPGRSHFVASLYRQFVYERAFFYYYTQFFLQNIGFKEFRNKYLFMFLKKIILTIFFPFFEILCERNFRHNSGEKLSFGTFVKIFNVFGIGLWAYYKGLKLLPDLIIDKLLKGLLRVMNTLKINDDANYDHWKLFWEKNYSKEFENEETFKNDRQVK